MRPRAAAARRVPVVHVGRLHTGVVEYTSARRVYVPCWLASWSATHPVAMRTLLRLRQLASASAAFSAAAAAVTTVAAECGASAPEEEPVRVPLATLQAEFLRVLRSERVGLAPEVAALCAKLFTENQRDGVYSHGLNRFGGFVSAVASGNFDRNARPTTEMQLGCVEQWDGHCGIGLWNANAAMSRAVELARVNGIGCVALRNTNHWMRAGSYGLQAARAGCVGICWVRCLLRRIQAVANPSLLQPHSHAFLQQRLCT
jgi:hypothetical protein